jgi:hypothetical protein
MSDTIETAQQVRDDRLARLDYLLGQSADSKSVQEETRSLEKGITAKLIPLFDGAMIQIDSERPYLGLDKYRHRSALRHIHSDYFSKPESDFSLLGRGIRETLRTASKVIDGTKGLLRVGYQGEVSKTMKLPTTITFIVDGTQHSADEVKHRYDVLCQGLSTKEGVRDLFGDSGRTNVKLSSSQLLQHLRGGGGVSLAMLRNAYLDKETIPKDLPIHGQAHFVNIVAPNGLTLPHKYSRDWTFTRCSISLILPTDVVASYAPLQERARTSERPGSRVRWNNRFNFIKNAPILTDLEPGMQAA